MHEKLLNLFKEPHIDNQEVLDMLFASIDNFPLTDCSTKAKVCFLLENCNTLRIPIHYLFVENITKSFELNGRLGCLT